MVFDESLLAGGEIPEVIPLFPLVHTVLLPGEVLPLHVVEPPHQEMIRDALAGAKVLGIVEGLTPPGELPSACNRVRQVGCASRIVHHQSLPDGRFLLWVVGVQQFTILDDLDAAVSYRLVRVHVERPRPPTLEDTAMVAAYRGQIVPVLARLVEEGERPGRSLAEGLEEANHSQLIAVAALVLELGCDQRQRLLEADTLVERYHRLFEMLRDEAPEALGCGSDDLH